MWLRLSDNFASDPVILNICRNRSDKTRVLGWVTELMLYCASQSTNGFVPEMILKEVVRSRRWRDQLTSPDNGGTALLHGRDDSCDCLKDRIVEWPRTSADYYMHHYLAFNPTKEEYDVKRAKEAELRDPELRALVKQRDRGMCRYCGIRVHWNDKRSNAGGVIDHVDPNTAMGAINLVVACRGCNSRKGNRTPEAAEMTLRPVPTGLDKPAEPTPDLGGDLQRTNQVTNGSATSPTTHVPVRDGTGRATDPGGSVGRAGSAGPKGDRPATGPPDQSPRRSVRPNPYHRRATTGQAPGDHAGLPSPSDVDEVYVSQFREEFHES
jgi:hypothetical protein